MEKKSQLTKERLMGRFKSQFDLVSYAIKLAENMIRSGRDSRYKTPIQNRAFQVLGEIALGLDKFEDVSHVVRDQPRRREEERVVVAAVQEKKKQIVIDDEADTDFDD